MRWEKSCLLSGSRVVARRSKTGSICHEGSADYVFNALRPSDFALASAMRLHERNGMYFSAGVRGLLAVAMLTGIAARAAVIETPIDWTGLGADARWTNGANWQPNTAPANDGTALVRFGVSRRPEVLVNASQSIRGLTFDFSSYTGYGYYTLSGATGATLTIGASGLTLLNGEAPALMSTATSTTSYSYSHGSVVLDGTLGVVLAADQTWSGSYNTSLTAAGPISGAGKLTLSGSATFTLEGNNTYTGGTVLNSTNVQLGTNTALGTGEVTVTGHSGIFGFGGDRTFANAVTLLGGYLDIFSFDGVMKFTGPVTMAGNTTIGSYGDQLYFNGNIGESGTGRILTFDGSGVTVLSGTNSYTGGTIVYGGALIFRQAASVPAAGLLTSGFGAYMGIGFATGTQAGFLDKFDKAATYGAIGFDTDPAATSVTTFTEPINLTGFNSYVTLGSATQATLTGAITPAGMSYQFGGGGGTLTVQSKLTGANSLTADSYYGQALTLNVVKAAEANDYTGSTIANNSAIVFGPGALSTNSADGSFYLGTGGYIGSQDASAAVFIPKFSAANTTGVIGFDSPSNDSPRTITGIDLQRFTGNGETLPTIAIGTSSAAIISGNITLAAAQPDLYFTGYKGGQLTVASILTGGGAVHIGNVYGDYPDFDANRTRISTVFLNAANTHTGGTALHSGRLVLGNTSALGTGSLTIRSNYHEMLPRLETSLTGNPVFTNRVVIEDQFEVGGVNAFTLAGNLTDGVERSGTLWKYGNFNLTLTGDNRNYSGGFFIGAGTLTFVGSNAAGSGKGWLNFGDLGGTAAFVGDGTTTSTTPAIAGLESYTNAARVDVGTGVTLAINQPFDSIYSGVIQGQGGIAKAGAAQLRLESANTFTGGTSITAGTLSYAKTGALGTGAVTLNGSTAQLAVEPGTTLANSLTFGPSGGTLTGGGILGSNVALTANSGIAPGHSVGQLTFNSGLTWNGGAFYNVEVQDASAAPGIGYDTISVNGTLVFNASLTSPFTINLSSLTSTGASGNLSNFVATNSYAWQIVSTTGGIINFNPAAVLLNTSGFTNSLGIGSFDLSVAGTNLMLNFTPVPEPSTWALLIAGFGVVAFTTLRRRRS